MFKRAVAAGLVISLGQGTSPAHDLLLCNRKIVM